MPDRVYICEAEGGLENGTTEEDIRRINKRNKEARQYLAKHNKKKAEYDKQEYKTPAEIYAEEVLKEEVLKVVGGDPIVSETTVPLTLVDTSKPAKRKYKKMFDVD
jgi:hypothetical protein